MQRHEFAWCTVIEVHCIKVLPVTMHNIVYLLIGASLKKLPKHPNACLQDLVSLDVRTQQLAYNLIERVDKPFVSLDRDKPACLGSRTMGFVNMRL